MDVLDSVSRLFTEIADEKHINSARSVIEMLSEYRNAEDMISIGAYAKGSNEKVDLALQKKTIIDNFLRQGINDSSPFNDTLNSLLTILD